MSQDPRFPPRRPDYGTPPQPQPGYGDPRAIDPPPYRYPAPSRPAPRRDDLDNGWANPGARTDDMPPYYRPPEPPLPSRRREAYVWPDNQSGGPAQPPAPAPRRERPARWDMPEAAAPAPPPRAYERPPERRRAPRGWSLPIEHIVLAAGIGALALALTQPWGVDAQGNTISLPPLARQVAVYTIGASAVLSGLLILLNKRMGCLALSSCLALCVMPLLVAASIGGVEVLTQLHVIPPLTPDHMKLTNRGFYLWWGGIIVTLVGLFFQLVTHRRKGIIGI